MPDVRIINRPAFRIAGLKTWISGPDNESFARFWEQCRTNGLLQYFRENQNKSGQIASRQTNSACLGVSRVEKDPARRSFEYMIAIEVPDEWQGQWLRSDLELFTVPAGQWAIFECRGKIPDALVAAEIYAFTQWLPNSGYKHALAPEMEVYPARDDETYCEFWLPIEKR